MKRFIAIFFVMLAGIAMLAHSFVPHHHHHSIFTIVVDIHNDASHSIATHLSNIDAHPHQEHDESEECIITDAYLTHSRVNEDHSRLSYNLLPDFQLELAYIIARLILSSPSDNRQTTEYPPYIQSIHICHTGTAAGLRAPPYNLHA